MMGVIVGIILMNFVSFVLAGHSQQDSQHEYGFCGVVHQYCTSLPGGPPSSHPRAGKAGPRGPPGIVNYTAIDKKISRKFSELEESMQEKLARWMSSTESEINEMKAELAKKDEEISVLKKHLLPTDCGQVGEVMEGRGGVANIFRNGKRYQVYCDMETDGGNWTVFQRRVNGSVDFYRTWEEYESGFGDKFGEFWLGLETVYQLTQDGAYELRVDLTDWNGDTAYAKYRTFSISGRSDGYRLTVGGYSGTAGDSLKYHNGTQFSTKDRDLDSRGGNCAELFHASWWFYHCASASLNGRYNDASGQNSGIFWFHWRRKLSYSLKESEMKFRKSDLV